MSIKDSNCLIECRKQIERKLNWLNADDLKQRDFQYLSDAVFEKTKIQLSLSTVKRLWADSYNRSFQISTLDALARYLDYQSWHHFKEKNFNQGDEIKIKSKKKILESKNNISKKSIRIIGLGFLVTVIAISLIGLFISEYKNKEVSYVEASDEVTFSSNKSVKEGVPNTIIFKYDLGSYESDSMCIQLSWNPKERMKIGRENEYYTSTYYYPGYHYARLIIDENIIKGHFIHITTNDWLTLIRYKPDDVLPTYIRNSEVISGGNMYASPYLLKMNNIDLTAPEFYVSYFNIQDFEGLDGDNFSFETEIKNSTQEQALICQNCLIFVYAENGAIVIPISSMGCVSDISISAGDIRKSGKTNDLSGLGCDLTDWRKIKGEVIDKNLKIYIDDVIAYELPYNKSIGKIKGWHYFFKGCGSVNYLNIYDSANTLKYKDDFWR